jgi:uncharacterized membrane protein
MIDISHFHPMLVHFPLALVVFGFLAELASLFFKKEVYLSRFGFYLLILGTLSALVAWLTGIFFTSEMSGSAGEIKEIHELFAWITLGTLIVTSVFRIFLQTGNRENTNLKWVAFGLYGLATVFVSITGFYGGTLVYNYMMPL